MIKSIVAAGLFCVAAVLIYITLNRSDMPHPDSAATNRAYSLPLTYEEHRAQQQWFATDAGKIAYTDHGAELAETTNDRADGAQPAPDNSINDALPTLVLIHGVPTSSWMYRKVIHRLQEHMRVVSVDLLGYGASDKPSEPESLYDAEQQAERVTDLLKNLNIDSYSLLVHDMGGLVGWELLRKNAPVKELVVLNTIVRKDGFNNPTFEKGTFSKMMTKAYSSDMTSSMMLKRTFDSMGMATTYKLSEEECRGYVVPIADGSDVALYSFFTGLNESLFAQLEQNAKVFQDFEGKTLVLWGAKDEILTTRQIPFLQQHLRIDDENIHVFDEQNHFLAEEIPEKVSKLVVEFLNQ